ncbi:MAG: DUF3168 domain-containing protein [Maricaulaceae bacterium]
MSGLETAFQRALFAMLSDAPELSDVLGRPARLYDLAPEEPVFPYVTFGQAETTPIGGDAAPVFEHRMSVHVWSRYGGRSEAKTLIAALRTVIDAGAAPIEGAHLVDLRTVFTDVFRHSDVRTIHGVLKLRAVLQRL